MALITPIAGRYSSTYNAVDTGITDEGYEVEQTSKVEAIDKSDAWGESMIDWIYRGGDCFAQFMSKEYKAGSLTPYWPYGTAIGTLMTTAAPIGRNAVAIAAAFALTATANTPAAAAPASLTAAGALLAPNYPAKLLFDSRLRKVPIRLQFLPATVSTTTSWFLLT